MHSTAITICRILQEKGFEAFFVGGAVRDMLLGKPFDDIDIATSAHPKHIEDIFQTTFAIGRHFGVILVKENGHHFEIATFRSDSGESDGRRPNAVFFTDKKQDAFRRDFTVNALFYDPISEEIFDAVGGREDLKNGVVRFVGDPDIRLSEDHLRLLRAVRFKNRLGFSFATETRTALSRFAKDIARLAPERIKSEMDKILIDDFRAAAFVDLHELGILPFLFPELEKLWNTPDADGLKSVGAHTALALSFLKNPSATLAWALLFHDLGKAETAVFKRDRWHFPDHQNISADLAGTIGKRMRFSRFDRQKIQWLCAHHIRFYTALKMTRAHRLHFFDAVFFEDLLLLARADSMASSGHADLVNAIEKEYHDCRERKLLPRFHADIFNGREIMEITGIARGPKIGILKRKLRFLQMEGKIHTASEAREWLLKRHTKEER